MIQEEAAPILAEVKSLRTDMAEMRKKMDALAAKVGG